MIFRRVVDPVSLRGLGFCIKRREVNALGWGVTGVVVNSILYVGLINVEFMSI
ncbi:MAG: hypothetical protein KAU03_03490 [Candidatus Altiarchaeales archaeon]|nr:hypothetical protein [Candidatus Altiarchaeales archaeon]